jgi:adenosylhomocysteinase
MYPIIAVNDSKTKFMFDNRYGTGQSVVDGMLRATNILLAGKVVVVCGYGWCGKGIAKRFTGMGSKIIIVEVDPVRALEAHLDGYVVSNLKEALQHADIVVSATGNKHVIGSEHFNYLKDGTILCNAGHFDIEIDLENLRRRSGEGRAVEGRTEVREYTLDGKRIFVLAEGRLVNLACAEGHPSSVMDLSFANQALALEYLATNYLSMSPSVYVLPEAIDREVALLKLKSLGIEIDKLTDEQIEYLNSFEYGT